MIEMKNWKKKAQEWALDRFEIIYDNYTTADFIEFKGSIGGDVLSYRFYKDGTITER